MLATGGNRSGKTELGVAKAIAVCIGQHPTLSERQHPPVYGRFVATTWEEGILNVIVKKFKQLVPRNYLYGGSWETAFSKGHRTLTFNLGGNINVEGSQIRFYTYQQHVDAHRGDDVDFVIMDEHGMRKYFDENMARLVDRHGWMMLTMTPEAGITWEEQEILQRWMDGDKDYEVYTFDSRLNPYLDRKGLAQLIKTLQNDPELFKAKIMGQFVALSGLVYPMFNEDIHVIPDNWDLVLNQTGHKQVITDGHLKKPWATIWMHWCRGGDVYVYQEDEWNPSGVHAQGMPSFATRIRTKSLSQPINDFIMDESLGGNPDSEIKNAFGEKDLIVQLNDIGLPYVGTNQASDKAVKPGIIKVRSFLIPQPPHYRPRLRIFQSCQRLIRQMRIYQYKKSTPIDDEEYRERIRKIDDDYPDVLRYGIMAEPYMIGAPASPGGLDLSLDQLSKPLYNTGNVQQKLKDLIPWDLE